MTRHIICTIPLIIILAASAFGQAIQQDFTGLGAIDWSQRVLRVVGTASATADSVSPTTHDAILQRAKKNAMESAIQLAKMMRLNGDSTVADRLFQNKLAAGALTIAARSYTVDAVSRLAPDAISLSIYLEIEPGISEALLPRNVPPGKLMLASQALCPICGKPWPRDKPVPPEVQLIPPVGSGEADRIIFTGLLIDARGLGVIPALAPRVLDSDGTPVYDLSFAHRDQAVTIGLVSYAREIGEAEEERLGERPNRIRAITGTGAHQSDVVISAADARIIHGAAAHYNFLAECRVVVLLGPAPSS